MPESTVEFELKLLVPRSTRTAVRAALAGRGAKPQTRRLVAHYFDTADRRLALAGMSLRLRREGRQWVQTLKAGGDTVLARFEHEVQRPDATLDAAAHAGTTAGERMAGLLADGEPLLERYGTDVRRTVRKLRTRGALVELAFDEGRIAAADSALGICELEFELLSGSASAMLALADRWRARFGLLVDPRSKAERGDLLAQGIVPAPVRRAMPVCLRRKVDVAEAWRSVLDECLAQILVNAIGLGASVGVEGRATKAGAPLPAADRADLVHQLRIGLRRLRSAIRLFRGWVAPPPEAIGAGARDLFRALGALRDQDVLAQAIEPALQRAGAPASAATPAGPASLAVVAAGAAPVPADAPARGDEVAALIAADETQRYLLALVAWRCGLDEAPTPSAGGPEAQVPVGDARGDDAAPAPLAPRARRRLARWQGAITSEATRFAQLDDAARHALRRRAKRLRYASEFVESLFSGGEMRRFLKRLQAAQQALGELSDLALVAQRYGSEPDGDPRDWFVLGWVAARREVVIAQAAAALAALGERHPFGKR